MVVKDMLPEDSKLTVIQKIIEAFVTDKDLASFENGLWRDNIVLRARLLRDNINNQSAQRSLLSTMEDLEKNLILGRKDHQMVSNMVKEFKKIFQIRI